MNSNFKILDTLCNGPIIIHKKDKVVELSTAPELIQKFKAKAECFHKDDFSSKVKNSWGELWGESGFLRIRKDGATAHCGLGGKSFLPSHTFSLVSKKQLLASTHTF